MTDKTKRLVFVHIEKAAGSSVHELMYANFFPYYVASPLRYTKFNDNHSDFVSDRELDLVFKVTPKLVAAGGHSLRAYESIDDSRYCFFTFLRDPIKRYLSHYFYQNEVMELEWDLQDFLQNEYFHDFMCKKICGEADAEKAISIITHENFCVCLVERYEESLNKLKKYIESNIKIGSFHTYSEKVNSRIDRRNAAEEGELISGYMDTIRQNNSEDLKLYQYALDKFDFEEETKAGEHQFDSNNRKKWFRLKVKLGKILRRFWFRPFEKFFFKTNVS